MAYWRITPAELRRHFNLSAVRLVDVPLARRVSAQGGRIVVESYDLNEIAAKLRLDPVKVRMAKRRIELEEAENSNGGPGGHAA